MKVISNGGTPQRATPEQRQQAKDVAKQVLEASLARTKGVDIYIKENGGIRISGGVQTKLDGSIEINVQDIAEEIIRGNIQDPVQHFTDLLVKHEVMHTAQVGTVRDLWEKAGRPGEFIDYFMAYHADLYTELAEKSPEALEKAIERYGQDAWIRMEVRDEKGVLDATKTNGARGAELFRMFGEDLMEGDASELVTAVSLTDAAREILEKAIAYLKNVIAGKIKGVTLSPEAKKYAVQLVKRYSELTGQEISKEATALEAELNTLSGTPPPTPNNTTPNTPDGSQENRSEATMPKTPPGKMAMPFQKGKAPLKKRKC